MTRKGKHRPTGGRSVLAMISSPVASRIDAVSRFAREHRWHLMFQDRMGLAHPFDWIGDGVIATIRGDKRELAFLHHLSSLEIPIVDLTFACPNFPCARVSCDHVADARLAAEHFLERNYRSLVFFSIDWGNVHERLWRGLSEKTAAERWVFSLDCPKVRWNDWGAVSRWLESKFANAAKPLGALTYSQGEAVLLLTAAKRLGIRVPEDFGIIAGGEDRVLLENQPVPITAVDTDMGRGAYEAAALLQRLMDGEPMPSKAVELPPKRIIERRSTDADGSNMQLVRDYRPVKLTNGLVALWDFVEDKPYVPQSTTAPYDYTTFPVVGPDGAEIRDGLNVKMVLVCRFPSRRG